MNLTIQLRDELQAALQAKAREQGISPDIYVSRVLEQTLGSEGESLSDRPFESGYGALAKYGPGPTEEDIDENRREMFRNFPRDI